MALILNIDTATEKASVSLANGDHILAVRFNDDAKQHASFVQPAIAEICEEVKTGLSEIDAVAVSNGPGSYTGLRVGLSSAKGICYALQKPLILLNTLQVIAESVRETADQKTLLCPMIDARRAEVFTAVYDNDLKEVAAPQALILDEHSFESLLKEAKLTFLGSGAEKWEAICKHSNASFAVFEYNPRHLNNLAQKAFQNALFADLAYAEPFYLKPFFDTHKH